MKRIIALIIVILLLLTACSSKTEVSRELLDHDYTPAFEAVETEYVYQWDCFNGEYRFLPDTHTVRHEAKYQLLYRVVYEDGSQDTIWEEVNEREYDNAVKELEGR